MILKQKLSITRKVKAAETRKRGETRLRKNCESAVKLSTEQQRQQKNMESTFGKPNSKGQYFISSTTGGAGRWMSISQIQQEVTSKPSDTALKVFSVLTLGVIVALAPRNDR